MALFTRRHALGLGIGALCATRLRPAAADNGAEMHGMSAFGDLKYPADFHHFDYVNVNAPKGGMFSLIPSVRAYNQSYFTFNSLNAYILKGEGAQGMDMTFTALMARAGDEPDECAHEPKRAFAPDAQRDAGRERRREGRSLARDRVDDARRRADRAGVRHAPAARLRRHRSGPAGGPRVRHAARRGRLRARVQVERQPDDR